MFVFMVRPRCVGFAVRRSCVVCAGAATGKKARGRVVTEEGRHTAAQCAQVLRLRPSLRCAQAGLNLATVSAPVWACSATSQLDKVGGGTFLLVLLMRGRKQVPHVQRIKLE